MDWIKKLNDSIEYIEENILSEVNYKKLGEIANCSAYHYQRMFIYMAGMSVSEYIRKRKMSLAVVDLLAGKKVIDVALKYGYKSPTAFNRAFNSIHGIAPSILKNDISSVKSFPAISFTLNVKGLNELNYRIEKKDAFQVVGISMAISNEIEENIQEIPQMWNRARKDNSINELVELMSDMQQGVFGISHCLDNEEFRYYIAVNSDTISKFEKLTIPTATWAIFSNQGAGISIQELQARIYLEWLPSSGYEYANLPDIELYLNPDPKDTKFEVWVPIKTV